MLESNIEVKKMNRDRLKAELKKQNLTVYKLAKLSGIPRSSIYQIFKRENQEPKSDTINKLAKALNIEADLLIKSEEELNADNDKKIDWLVEEIKKAGYNVIFSKTNKYERIMKVYKNDKYINGFCDNDLLWFAEGLEISYKYQFKHDNIHSLIKSDRYTTYKDEFETPAYDLVSYGFMPLPKQHMLPVYGFVSAGNGILVEENIIGYELADERFNNTEYFYLRVKGDSMEPEVKENDYVLVKKQTSVDSGSYAVVIVDNNEGVIKQIKYGNQAIYGEDWIELHSINPRYAVRQFKGSEVQRVYVIGEVIEIKRKIKN